MREFDGAVREERDDGGAQSPIFYDDEVIGFGLQVRDNCALHLVHHTRKPPAGTAHQAGDLYAVRGGGAIVGDAHFVFTLADMGQPDAESLGATEVDRNRSVRLDDAAPWRNELEEPGW